MKLHLTILFIFIVSLSSFAQNEQTLINIQLDEYLKTIPKSSIVHLLVKAKNIQIEDHISELDGKIKVKSGLNYSISISAENVWQLARSESLLQIDFSLAQAHLMNDTMLINNNVVKIHQSFPPLKQKFDGEGTIIGIIDSGIDFSHPDFKDSLGNTRVLAIWDQNLSTNANTPSRYGYGQAFDSAAINSNNCPHDDPVNQFGHGSMVTGAAASNGLATGNFKGVAPNANIIVVASNFGSSNFLASIADATDYIYRIADSLGKPCVINASLGTYVGSHDGKDVAAQIIDGLIKAKRGRAFVAANGNAGDQNFHLGYQVTADTNFTWFKPVRNVFNPYLHYRLYADSADFVNVNYSIGADEMVPNPKFRGRIPFRSIQGNLNTYLYDTIFSPSNNTVITEIRSYAEKVDGVYMLEIFMNRPDSLTYNYRFETTGSGRFDCWSSNSLMPSSDMVYSNLPTVAQFPAIVNYKRPDTLQTMVSSFTCLPSVISVGNYQNRKKYRAVNNVIQTMPGTPGRISSKSSLGPNRLGVTKPDISASGDYTLSAGRIATMQASISADPTKISADSMHMRNGGTSMASPVVAGIVAIYLQKCPTASYAEINQAILNHAKSDAFTGVVPNYQYGFGKVDGYTVLINSIQKPQISPITLQNLCMGDTAILFLNSTNYSKYLWSNSDTTSYSNAFNSGKYYVDVENVQGCKSTSDSILLAFNPTPLKPKLIQHNDTLLSITSGHYNWYKDGFKINGAIDSFLVVNQNGNYWNRLINLQTSCGKNSDSIYYSITDLKSLKENISRIKVYPNPAKEFLTIENIPQNTTAINLYNPTGQHILLNLKSSNNKTTLNTSSIKNGVYILSIETSDGVFNTKIIIQ
jgi:subtilisin family serine protease